jgi:hypothetical protein
LGVLGARWGSNTGQVGGAVVGHYANFFITSAGASAAILGLLVVAVSVVNAG